MDQAITGNSGWYVKYVSTLAGACRWCEGDKQITYTLGGHAGKTVSCPRCNGTGDEPYYGDRLRKAGQFVEKEPEVT